MPVFDGRKNLYSPIEFQRDQLEFYISLPIPSNGGKLAETQNQKLFRVNIRLVSKLTGEKLNKYLKEQDDGIPLPQDYLHALDIVLREGPVNLVFRLVGLIILVLWED